MRYDVRGSSRRNNGFGYSRNSAGSGSGWILERLARTLQRLKDFMDQADLPQVATGQ
jgi:hypothetical protein